MQKIIEKINYYNCGYCINNLKMVFKNTKKEKRKFPAGVFLIKHKKYGYILFDTGYSLDIYKSGIIGKIYNLFNSTFVNEKDIIVKQLKKDGINPRKINYIILSHLHPDHVGGIKYFKNAKIIISKKALDTFKKKNIRNLIFKNLFPSWFLDNLKVIDDDMFNKKYKYFNGFDLFNDGSIIITNLEGHAKGQICCMINGNIFLGADTCWGNDLIDKSLNLKLPAKIIQNNLKEYYKTINILKQMRDDKIMLCFSHDTYKFKELQYERKTTNSKNIYRS